MIGHHCTKNRRKVNIEMPEVRRVRHFEVVDMRKGVEKVQVRVQEEGHYTKRWVRQWEEVRKI